MSLGFILRNSNFKRFLTDANEEKEKRKLKNDQYRSRKVELRLR